MSSRAGYVGCIAENSAHVKQLILIWISDFMTLSFTLLQKKKEDKIHHCVQQIPWIVNEELAFMFLIYRNLKKEDYNTNLKE